MYSGQKRKNLSQSKLDFSSQIVLPEIEISDHERDNSLTSMNQMDFNPVLHTEENDDSPRNNIKILSLTFVTKLDKQLAAIQTIDYL